MHSKSQKGHACRQAGIIEIILLIGGVVAVLAVGGFFLYTTKKLETKKLNPTALTGSASQAAISGTTDLNTEIESLVIEDFSQDFKDIDAELNSL